MHKARNKASVIEEYFQTQMLSSKSRWVYSAATANPASPRIALLSPWRLPVDVAAVLELVLASAEDEDVAAELEDRLLLVLEIDEVVDVVVDVVDVLVVEVVCTLEELVDGGGGDHVVVGVGMTTTGAGGGVGVGEGEGGGCDVGAAPSPKSHWP
jgi:hypothetical protein